MRKKKSPSYGCGGKCIPKPNGSPFAGIPSPSKYPEYPSSSGLGLVLLVFMVAVASNSVLSTVVKSGNPVFLSVDNV